MQRHRNLVLLSVALFVSPLIVATFRTADAQQRRVFTQAPTMAEYRIRTSAEKDDESDEAGQPKESKDLTEGGPNPRWIWGRENSRDRDRFFLRKRFAGGARAAQLVATCDNRMTVWINGKRVAGGDDWESPVRVDVGQSIGDGENELMVEAVNEGGSAGMLLKLAIEKPDGGTEYVVTDGTWSAAESREAENWTPAAVIARYGARPWGNVLTNADAGSSSSQPREVFNLLPGFRVELLYTVPRRSQGSWVCLAVDPQGRIIASDQGGEGLYRITPPAIGGDGETRVERLDVDISSAQGLLFAFDSLYVSVNGGRGSGLYRLRDTDGDDQFDKVDRLKSLRGGGEHGPHALRLSPDGKSLYVIAGNHTDLPEDIVASRIPTNWSEDLLLPRQWDARGHAQGKLAPGGWICRTDPEGRDWEVISIGYRNSYDMDLNDDGELFAYDADMEWDMGSPWYRPTRLVHATSGSEFGWRSGTGKWPAYFIDSLPEVVDIGPGSPVGVTFGRGAKFPAKYQKALYLLDWTFGTIYAIHLTPSGASYVGTKEEFLSRTPLPLTDAVIGKDGAMYFAVGGRGAQSELYRVTYVGDESTDPVRLSDRQGADLRAMRREMEALHRPIGADAVEAAWPRLSHQDRHIRYAARIAVEKQDVRLWRERALAETDPRALVAAMVALARQGDESSRDDVIEALGRVDFGQAAPQEKLDLLRAYSLAFIRLGGPDQTVADSICRRLDPHYPATDGERAGELNRELCRVLAYLNSPTVIDKTLAMMKEESSAPDENLTELLSRNRGYGRTIAQMYANHPELQKIHYAYCLRTMKFGWTLQQREDFFAWFDRARRRSGGASYEGFIDNIREEAWANVSPEEREAMAASAPPPVVSVDELPKPKGPGREWTLDELVEMASGSLAGRDFENGKKMFAAAQCASCHRYLGTGGAQGPDLSNVAGRFGIKDLCEAIVDPNKVISDQYRATTIETKNGRITTGRIVDERDGELVVEVNPLNPNEIARIAEADVAMRTPSPVSPMPANLLNSLNRDEVLDLLAYVLSRGNSRDAMFVNR